MTITLTATWNPRGEFARLQRMIPQIASMFAQTIVVLSPDTPISLIKEADELPGVRIVQVEHWTSARLKALKESLRTDTQTVMQADLDRLLHWLECYPTELKHITQRATEVDCLVLGRTDRAWATHPRCMAETEVIFNRAFSHILQMEMDFGAGAKAFSHRAVDYLTMHTDPAWGWALDAAWPLMLHRAGFSVVYEAVDGLEWETPDQYRETAADARTRKRIATAHDADPKIWQKRVWVAREITRVGLLAAEKFPPEKKEGHPVDTPA